MASVPTNLSALCEKLILAGAEAIREEGREEVRQQFAAQRQREMELDDVALRFTSQGQATDEASRVSVQWLQMEVLRQAVNRRWVGTIRDESKRAFAMVITELTADEMAALKRLSMEIMNNREDNHE